MPRVPTLNTEQQLKVDMKKQEGQSFMIDVLLESYLKKEKHFAYFTEVFHVQI